MPESPRWLVSKGKIEEAKKVLFKIRAQDEYPEQELREIQIAVDEEKVYSSCRLFVAKYVSTYLEIILKKTIEFTELCAKKLQLFKKRVTFQGQGKKIFITQIFLGIRFYAPDYQCSGKLNFIKICCRGEK